MTETRQPKNQTGTDEPPAPEPGADHAGTDPASTSPLDARRAKQATQEPTELETTSPELREETPSSGRGADSIRMRTLPPAVRWAVLAGSVVVALLITLPTIGFNPVAVVVIASLVYCLTIYLASRFTEGHRHAVDRLVTGIVTTFFVLALIPLVSVLSKVIVEGSKRFDAQFFTYSMRGVVGEGGGAYHAIIGTLTVTAITTIISVPIGIMAAIYLVEYGRKARLARALTFFVDVMTGIPSIVAGLFAVSLFTLLLGPGPRSALIGAVALSVLMIPVVVRSTEEMLRLVPHDLREASYALGVPRWLTILKVVLPTAIAGIATGVTLAVARVIGETAPLLVTVGITTGTNSNIFDGRIATLPVFAYYSYATPGIPKEAFIERAWAAALTLIIIVMTLNILARLISKFFAPKTGR